MVAVEAVLETQHVPFGIIIVFVAEKANAGPIRILVGQFGGHGVFGVFLVGEDADGLKLFS